MMKKHLFVLVMLILTLTLLLSGCGGGDDQLEGKYVVTFEMNGGTLDLASSNVSTRINYAYEPGSHIIDPASYGNYELKYKGYRFTGWYRSEQCLENEKWDFKTDTVDKEKITLYAGWVEEIVYTYDVCYVDGDNTVTLGAYNVSKGDVFEDYRKYAASRTGYTPSGYYSDPECTVPWSFTDTHPGGETDTRINVYVDYIEGEWILVDSYQKLLSAIGNGNIYLMGDIDCSGGELYFSGTFAGIFEGNGYKVSNFTVNKSGSTLMPSCSIFQALGEGSVVRNVRFEDVTYSFFDVERASKLKVAALAREANGATVSNVSVSGSFNTDYTGELPRLQEVFYDEASTAEITGFTASITVEQQS